MSSISRILRPIISIISFTSMLNEDDTTIRCIKISLQNFIYPHIGEEGKQGKQSKMEKANKDLDSHVKKKPKKKKN